MAKWCAYPSCREVVRACRPSQVKRQKFCSRRCANRARRENRRLGHWEKAIWRGCRLVQQALAISGEPPVALIRAVRQIRQQAYGAGWTVVQRKVHRAVKRGLLIRQPVAGVDGRRAD